MVFDLSQFREVFFDEASEHLAIMASCLERLEPAAPAADVIAETYRCAHSIKGASATFGFDEMAGLARAMSQLLDKVRQGQVALDDRLIDACSDARDVLCAQLAARRRGAQVGDETAAAVLSRLVGAAEEAAPVTAQPAVAQGVIDATHSKAATVAVLQETVMRMQALVARMEILSREQAVLVEQASAAVQEFERQVGALVGGRPLARSEQDVPAVQADVAAKTRKPVVPGKAMQGAVIRPSRRGCGAPLPKVRELASQRRSLEQEWEEF